MIVDAIIKQQILDMQNKMVNIKDIEESKEKFAEYLTDIIVTAIKSASVSGVVTTPDTINGTIISSKIS